MTDIPDTFPTSLSATGHWAFRASYEVHDGWEGMDGKGDSIGEAIEAAFGDNGDGSLEEAWDENHWRVDALSFNGQPIRRLADKAHAEATGALAGFRDYGSAEAMEALIRQWQAAHAEKARVDALAGDLVKLLVRRNRGR